MRCRDIVEKNPKKVERNARRSVSYRTKDDNSPYDFTSFNQHERDIMWRVMAGTALACALFINGVAVAAETESNSVPSPLVLKTEAGRVDVYRPDGSFLQSLPYEGDEPDDDNRDHFTFVEDMNFDGFPDVGVLFWEGARIHYDAWLWQPDMEALVQYAPMRDLPNPGFDANAKLVRSFEPCCGTGMVKSVFAWENGTLVELERMERIPDEDSGTTTVSRYARGDDGVLQLVEEEIIRPEETEN